MEIESKYDYDLFVIGGGSGGISAAKKSAKLGASVALADFVNPTPTGTKWGLGGTCVNVGCIPKKLMHYASILGELKEDQKNAGWEINSSARHNWSMMLASVNTHIKRLNWGYKKTLINEGVKYFNAYATFKDEHTIILTNRKGKKTEVSVDKVIIATGGRPTYLNMPNIRELAITSDDLFWRKTPPGRTLVIGGGYIAVECAGFLRGMGSEVDMLIRSTVLKKFDRDMINRVTKDLVEKGIRMMRGGLMSVDKTKEGVLATFQIEKNADLIKGGILNEMMSETEILKEEYNTVLLAIGRTPETSKIGLDSAGVVVESNGKLAVNQHYQTNVENVFAIGDIKLNSPELTPVAIQEGIFLANELFGSKKMKPINYNAIPTTIFSPLEYACVGLSEENASLQFGEENIEVYHKSFKPLEWNFMESRLNDLCYCKVIINKSDENTVLGIHYAGPNAGEVMQAYGLALTRKTSFEELIEVGKGIWCKRAGLLISVILGGNVIMNSRDPPNQRRGNCYIVKDEKGRPECQKRRLLRIILF